MSFQKFKQRNLDRDKKKLSVLIYGSFAKGALEHQFLLNFKKLDIEVYNFDSSAFIYKNTIIYKLSRRITPRLYYNFINIELLKVLNEIKPKVLLVFKGMELFPETLKEIKERKILLCNYNPDHPFIYYSSGSGNSYVKDSINIYDIYFSFSKEITAKLKKIYNIYSYWIPFGYSDSYNPSIQSNSDIIFIGAWDLERELFLEYSSIANLKIYGPPIWAKKIRSKDLKVKLQNIEPYENEYNSLTNRALASINLLRPQNLTEKSHNMRTFEIPGYGGLQITNRTEEHLELFEENKEIILFDSKDEFKEKVLEINNNKIDILKLKKNARLRCQRSNYSYFYRVTEIYNIITRHIYS